MKTTLLLITLFVSTILQAEIHHDHHHDKAVSTYHEIETLLKSAKEQRDTIFTLNAQIESNIDYNLERLNKLYKQAAKDVKAGLMCSICKRPKTIIELQDKWSSFQNHLKNEFARQGGSENDGYAQIILYFDPKIKKAREIHNKLNHAKKIREEAIWETFKLRDDLLYPSYTNSLNGILQEYWLAREKTAGSMKMNADILKEIDELLVILPKSDPEYKEFHSMMTGTIRSMKQEIKELNDLRMKANEQVEKYYDTYSGFNNSIKSIAWTLGEEPELGTAGSFVGNSFNIPAFQILVSQPLQRRTDEIDDFIDNRTRGLINRWSRGL